MAKRKDLIKGIHPVEEAINSGHPIRKVLIQQNTFDDATKNIVRLLKKFEIPFQRVPKVKLDKISGNHQGMIAFSSPIEFVELTNFIPSLFENGITPLLCIIDGVTDVRNIGGIARSAEFLGVNALVIPSRGVGDLNEDAIKSSAGGLLTLPICRVNYLEDGLSYLLDYGFQLVIASEKANNSLDQIDFKLPTAIILGAEDKGVSSQIKKLSTHQVKINRIGELDSLNVSVAAGIFFYVASQQRLIG